MHMVTQHPHLSSFSILSDHEGRWQDVKIVPAYFTQLGPVPLLRVRKKVHNACYHYAPTYWPWRKITRILYCWWIFVRPSTAPHFLRLRKEVHNAYFHSHPLFKYYPAYQPRRKNGRGKIGIIVWTYNFSCYAVFYSQSQKCTWWIWRGMLNIEIK